MTTSYSSFEDMPALVPVEQMPPDRTSLDIYHGWRLSMGPLGFGARRLWVTLTDWEGRVSPVVQQVDEIPARPRPGETDNLMLVLDHLRPFFDGGAVALLYSRPGRGPMNGDDRSWARSLTAASRAARIPLWPVHFADDEEPRVFAPDDLAAAP